MSVWQDKIWIIGGEGLDSQSDRIRYNDVWSADVSEAVLPTFKLELESAPWSARAYHQTVSFAPNKNKKYLWLFGGAAPSCTNFPCDDVWSSSDAVTWTKHEVVDTRWEGRYAHAAVAYEGMVFVFGGIGTDSFDSIVLYADVWVTNDPSKSWTNVVKSLTPSSTCKSFGCGAWVGGALVNVFDEMQNAQMCAIGGVYEADSFASDVACASSNDPENATAWSIKTSYPGWSGRIFHEVVYLGDSNGTLLMGGSLWSDQWLSGNIWSEWNDADCPSPGECKSNPEYVPKNMIGVADMWLWPNQPKTNPSNDLFEWIRIYDVPWGPRAGHAAVTTNGRVYITAGSSGNHLYSDLWCYGCDNSPPSPSPTPSVPPGKVEMSKWVLVGIISGSVVAVFILTLAFRQARFWGSNQNKDNLENPFAYRRVNSMSPRRLNSEEQALERMLHASHESSEWLLDRSNVMLKEEIARGSSGWIFKGMCWRCWSAKRVVLSLSLSLSRRWSTKRENISLPPSFFHHTHTHTHTHRYISQC